MWEYDPVINYSLYLYLLITGTDFFETGINDYRLFMNGGGFLFERLVGGFRMVSVNDRLSGVKNTICTGKVYGEFVVLDSFIVFPEPVEPVIIPYPLVREKCGALIVIDSPSNPNRITLYSSIVYRGTGSESEIRSKCRCIYELYKYIKYIIDYNRVSGVDGFNKMVLFVSLSGGSNRLINTIKNYLSIETRINWVSIASMMNNYDPGELSSLIDDINLLESLDPSKPLIDRDVITLRDIVGNPVIKSVIQLLIDNFLVKRITPITYTYEEKSVPLILLWRIRKTSRNGISSRPPGQ